MRLWWLLGVIGCSASSDPSRVPEREADVLIEAPTEITVIYQDGDSDWQLAPHIGDRLGFDLISDRYAVTFVDAANRQLETLYTTLAEQADISVRPKIDPKRHAVAGTLTGVGELGGAIAGKGGKQVLGGSDASQSFMIDVVEGPQVIAAGNTGKNLFGAFKLASLAVRRDVVVLDSLTLDIDFATEALATTEIALRGPGACNYVSTFSADGTEIVISKGRGASLVAPHPDQWLATDRLSLEVLCGFQILTYDIGPNLGVADIEIPPTLGVSTVTTSEDNVHFEWSGYETATAYEGLLVEFPCDAFALLFARDFTNTDACDPRFTVRVTPGWADLNGLSLDAISPAVLEDLGLWDPAFELATPRTWMVWAQRDTNGASVRAMQRGLLDQ